MPANDLSNAIVRELLRELSPRFLGPRGSVWCYRPKDGGCPSKDFLDGLPTEASASYAVSFTRWCQGQLLRGDKWHRLDEKRYGKQESLRNRGLCEYKDIQSKSRVIHIEEQGFRHVLLFGFDGKNENSIDKVHINRARRLRDEYLERREEIRKRLEGKK